MAGCCDAEAPIPGGRAWRPARGVVFGWLIVLAAAAVCATAVLWTLRQNGARLLGSILGFVLLISALALYWQRAMGSYVQVVDASSAGNSIALPCADVERLVETIQHSSNGLIVIDDANKMRLPSAIWAQLGAPERSALMSLLDQLDRCKRTGSDRAQIVDADGGAVLYEFLIRSCCGDNRRSRRQQERPRLACDVIGRG